MRWMASAIASAGEGEVGGETAGESIRDLRVFLFRIADLKGRETEG